MDMRNHHLERLAKQTGALDLDLPLAPYRQPMLEHFKASLASLTLPALSMISASISCVRFSRDVLVNFRSWDIMC